MFFKGNGEVIRQPDLFFFCIDIIKDLPYLRRCLFFLIRPGLDSETKGGPGFVKRDSAYPLKFVMVKQRVPALVPGKVGLNV